MSVYWTEIASEKDFQEFVIIAVGNVAIVSSEALIAFIMQNMYRINHIWPVQCNESTGVKAGQELITVQLSRLTAKSDDFRALQEFFSGLAGLNF